MTTSQTTNLHLTKAVKGTAEPFSIDAVNANLDAIDDAVGELKTTKYVEITQTANQYYSISDLYVMQCGNVVIVSFIAECTTPYGGSPGAVVVTGLPKPKQPFYQTQSNAWDGAPIRVHIDSNGTMYFRFGTSAKGGYSGNLVYFV